MAEPQKWRMKVEHLTVCNCNWGCPCSFNAPPTYGNCEGAIAFRVVNGRYGDVPLDGVKFALIVSWPGAIHEGNGRAALYIDSRAQPEQRRAVRTIATGKAGGPISVLASTLTKGVVTRDARIDFRMDGARSRFKVEGVADVAFDWLRNPVTGDKHEASIGLPTGMLTKREEAYNAKVCTIDAGPKLSFSYPGRSALASVGNWRGP